jgi:threonine 3-dehydrogenase
VLSEARTRAAVWDIGGVHLESLPLPEPGPGEVLLGIRLATVCGSDRHTVAGRRPAPCPSVLGHEAVGVVVGAGPGTTVGVGDRVVAGVAVPCGSCDRCRACRTAKCRTVRKVGHEPLRSDWPLSGTYAEHLLLPHGATVVPVPDDLPDEVAAPAACATATVSAAVEAAGDVRGRRALVSGAGMLGVTAVAALARSGAEVVVVDPDPGRRALAVRFGAVEARAPGPQPTVDVAVEVSGARAAVAAALDVLDVGGRLVLAGSVSPGAPVALDPERVVRSWLTVTGVHNYEPRHLVAAIELLAATPHLPWGDLVEPPVPLADVGRLLTGPDAARPRASVRP